MKKGQFAKLFFGTILISLLLLDCVEDEETTPVNGTISVQVRGWCDSLQTHCDSTGLWPDVTVMFINKVSNDTVFRKTTYGKYDSTCIWGGKMDQSFGYLVYNTVTFSPIIDMKRDPLVSVDDNNSYTVVATVEGLDIKREYSYVTLHATSNISDSICIDFYSATTFPTLSDCPCVF